MDRQQDGIDYLNDGLDGRTEYRFWSDRGVLGIRFYVGEARKKASLSVAAPEVLSAAQRAALRTKASEIVASERKGRVLESSTSSRVLVASTLDELAVAWIDEQRLTYPDSWKTRRIQLTNVCKIFSAMTGTLTPLQRMVDDAGPQFFVDARMRERDKETVKKESGILFQFLDWCAKKKFISTQPPRPAYRKKDYGVRMGPQRSEAVDLSDEIALRIISRLPAFASRGGRKGGKLPEKAFVVRDRCRFAFETSFRPSTIERLEMGRHWTRGARVLVITRTIDKGRNAAQKGKDRTVPLTDVAYDILMEHAPESGLIFGKHDFRIQWKRAAIAVLGELVGSKCSVYDLRHSAIGRMRSKVGAPLKGSMHLAGHSTTKTHDKYTHPELEAARETVELLNVRNRELDAKPL